MRHTIPTAAVLLCLAWACEGRPDEPVGGASTIDSLSRSLEDLDRLIVADPRNAALYIERARLHRNNGRTQDAVDDLERALVVDSTSTRAHIDIADLYYSTLKIPEAYAHYTAAVRFDPAGSEPKLKLAELELVAFRAYDKAVALSNEVLRDDPNAAQAYFIKGWAHMEKGDTATAISSFRTCVEQDAAHYKAWMELALLHAARHDPLAMAYFNTAIDLRPGEVEPLYGKAMYCQENGMDSLALDAYDRIKRIDPGNALAWYNTGYVMMEYRHDPRAAIGQFTAAGKLLPTYHQAFHGRGLAYERLDVLDSAAMDYQAALRIDPAYDPAIAGLNRLKARGLRVVPRKD